MHCREALQLSEVRCQPMLHGRSAVNQVQAQQLYPCTLCRVTSVHVQVHMLPCSQGACCRKGTQPPRLCGLQPGGRKEGADAQCREGAAAHAW